MTILFDKKTYNLMAIKRTLVYFNDAIYYELNQNDDNIIIEIESKNDDIDLSIITKDIKNKVIDEEVRMSIENETKDIRDSLIKYAFSNDKPSFNE